VDFGRLYLNLEVLKYIYKNALSTILLKQLEFTNLYPKYTIEQEVQVQVQVQNTWFLFKCWKNVQIREYISASLDLYIGPCFQILNHLAGDNPTTGEFCLLIRL